MTRRRKRARKYINLRERLAAAYAMLLPQEQRDELRARKVPAKTVMALFTDDHGHLHALGGSDRWFNLTPMLREPHKEKSRRDTSIVAKVDRIDETRREHLAAMARKLIGPSPFTEMPKRRIANRGFSKGHRPLRSRNSFERRQP